MVDVGIVGAGIHGASAAYHLASAGVRTVVFERGTPAGGPTGLSSGICRAYYTNSFLARMARDSIEMFARFPELTNGRSADLRRTGMLYLHPPEDEPEVRESVGRLNELGIETDLLDPEELVRRHPAIDPAGLGICAFERHAGHADPVAATTGLFERAVELGAEARLGDEVVAIERRGTGAAVTTGDGERTECPRLLLAAGPWTRPLAAMVGVELSLTVERHVVVSFGWGSAEPTPAYADTVSGHYLRPEGTDQYLVGHLDPAPQADPDDFAGAPSEDEVVELAGLVVSRVPQLERSEVQRGWASLYDVSPDWQPSIGEIAPGVFVDAGTSGHGFKLAPALGREVARLVMGEEPDPELAQFDALRFAEDRALPAGYREARILG